MFATLLKDMIKDADEQPDERHIKRSGRVLSIGASVPIELGCSTILASGCVQQVFHGVRHTKLSEPYPVGILRRLIHTGMINH